MSENILGSADAERQPTEALVKEKELTLLQKLKRDNPTPTKEETFNAKVGDAVNSSMVSFHKNSKTATDEEILDAKNKAFLGIVQAFRERGVNDAKEIRQAKKKAIRESADELGVEFLHLEYFRHDMDPMEQILDGAIKSMFSGSEFIVMKTPVVMEDPIRVTVAARLIFVEADFEGEESYFAIEAAFALKHPNDGEAYDKLIGQEYALERFKEGKSIEHRLGTKDLKGFIQKTMLGRTLDIYQHEYLQNNEQKV